MSRRRMADSLNGSIRRRLTRSPRLLTAYLAFSNRGHAAFRRRGLAMLAVFMAWGAGVAWLATSPAVVGKLQRHVLLLAALSAFVACVLVARRRSIERAEAPRSWVAALPMAAARARWESICIETGPVLALACGSILTFTHIGLAVAGGLIAGSLASYAAPAAKVVELPPGSRYVPHRRTRREPIPQGSLAALGWWPVRRMFASARPQAVARAALPIMLLIPMGARADAAMLLLASLTVAGAMALLVSAFVAVSAHARRWLRPLPLSPRALTGTILKPGVAVMICAVALEIWLRWLGGTGR